jgi:hypothetical protein
VSGERSTCCGRSATLGVHSLSRGGVGSLALAQAHEKGVADGLALVGLRVATLVCTNLGA